MSLEKIADGYYLTDTLKELSTSVNPDAIVYGEFFVPSKPLPAVWQDIAARLVDSTKKARKKQEYTLMEQQKAAQKEAKEKGEEFQEEEINVPSYWVGLSYTKLMKQLITEIKLAYEAEQFKDKGILGKAYETLKTLPSKIKEWYDVKYKGAEKVGIPRMSPVLTTLFHTHEKELRLELDNVVNTMAMNGYLNRLRTKDEEVLLPTEKLIITLYQAQEIHIQAEKEHEQALVADKEAERQQKLADKEAAKAQKEADKQKKAADKEAERQLKEAEKEAERQQKLADKEAERQRKEAEKEAEKAAQENNNNTARVVKKVVKTT